MSSLDVDRENENANFRLQTVHGGKVAAVGGTRPAQRKPLGQVNRLESVRQAAAGAGTKGPGKTKTSQPAGKVALVVKPPLSTTQLPLKPRLQVSGKGKTEAMLTSAVREQAKEKPKPVNPGSHRAPVEIKSYVDVTNQPEPADDDPDIELMFPAPDEDDFSNWFPASEKALLSRLKSWRPSVCRAAAPSDSPTMSPPRFDDSDADEEGSSSFGRSGVDRRPIQLPPIHDLPPLEDELDLEYLSVLQ